MKIARLLKLAMAYLRASFVYLKTLLGPMDTVDSICSRGHSLLKEWTHCPKCRLINRNEDLKRKKKVAEGRPARLGLYCLSGANEGQSFLLSAERNTLGCEPSADIVLTPESLNTRAQYQLLMNGKIKLTSSDTHYFKLNGQPQQSATLFDFDELELLDNRFLVLDLGKGNLS